MLAPKSTGRQMSQESIRENGTPRISDSLPFIYLFFPLSLFFIVIKFT